MNQTCSTPAADRHARRGVLKNVMKVLIAAAGAGLVGLGVAGSGAGCEKGTTTSASTQGGPITVGFMYVGTKQDYGYNQSHAEGAAALKSIPGVKVIEQENVPETIEVEKAMQGMIKQDEASVLFPTSYGYFDPSILKVAPQFPKVQFLHCGGSYTEGKTPTNVGTYFGYIDECEYTAGIVAGHMTKSKKLGFVAAKPIPQVLRDINALTLAARSVDPSITTSVVFTGNWFEPVKEAEATNNLIASGCDVINMHVDSPKTIIETAGRQKVYTIGYHSNGAPLAPDYYLTGSEWNWAKPYTDYINTIKAGKAVAHSTRGGLKDGFVKMSAYGPAVSAEAKKHADEVKDKFLKGDFVIFKGPLKDNEGKEIYKDGESHVQTDPALEGMNYLVEGVIGKMH